ncbi:MAG TPA: 23S rRNA (pseudouridine(1915)-N(3))-methyltransferase RlmH [Candidatus Nanoarchaeia archaeon]|nr:23S rRNA (pseudouridine(1915)-N(3))-methyltransferase RlmH [Candidatus Nanoarchaeia archaeon]
MIKILFLGKTRERFIFLGIEEYFKRLRRFTKIEIVEVKNLNFDFKDEFVIVFDVNGKMLSSEELAATFKHVNKNIIIILGDEKGLNEELKKKANMVVSISRMTFTHELARLIVMEQVYRAFTIINNLKYHKI